MELHTIPYRDKIIVYRPLQQLAFIGNRAMARLCERFAAGEVPPAADDQPTGFLRAIGFFEEDQQPEQQPMDADPFRPAVCVLFLTNTCNLRCIYCYAHGGGEAPAKRLPLALARAAMETVCRHAADRGQDHFSLCFHGGGEPTTAWTLLTDCVALARQAPLPARINLTSNGVWSKEQRAWILDNLDEISLSFDGPPAIQNRQRPTRSGDESHRSAMRTVQELDRRGMAYGIRVTVVDRSIERIPEIVEYLCRETGAQAFQVEPAFDHGRARTDRVALAQHAAFTEAFMAGYDIACRHGRHMYYSGARPWLLTDRFCGAFAKALIVGPDGFLTSCYEICDRQHELAGDFIFGDMQPDGAIGIDAGIRQAFLAKIEERRQTCRTCFCFRHCAGDCPSKTFSARTGGHLHHGSRCELNRTLTRELIVHSIAAGNGLWRGRAQAVPGPCGHTGETA
ncbi:MAG: radical SAM protein [Desulfobulbus sp.]|jgi:uncharacterized protein|uniref:radical SAM/SPASM domain-containing protein n=1 Tax=Desulfobulbus sp. TaxID=895 RepID=UPI00284E9703|nr:radical SAM protein [Desulfobulbus sp.]MDR2549549.1 radical SAM protein [Desulfobulbus sp.]